LLNAVGFAYRLSLIAYRCFFWLIVKSTFLPPWLGVITLIGGLGWMTFASGSPASARAAILVVIF